MCVMVSSQAFQGHQAVVLIFPDHLIIQPYLDMSAFLRDELMCGGYTYSGLKCTQSHMCKMFLSDVVTTMMRVLHPAGIYSSCVMQTLSNSSHNDITVDNKS